MFYFASAVLILLLSPCCGLFWPKAAPKLTKNGDDYGVDITTAIHHKLDPQSHYGKAYEENLKGCYDMYSRRECDMTESSRIEMNLAQPKAQVNYTELGFMKMKAPKGVYDDLISFYKTNYHRMSKENWPRGNTYVNHWNSPTEFLSVENNQLEGGGYGLKDRIWNGMRPVLEEWTGEKLRPTSLYGIRVYRNGSLLSTRK